MEGGINLVFSAWRNGRPGEAVELAANLLGDHPKDPFLRLLMGVSLLDLEKNDDAIFHLALASEHAPLDPQIHYNYAVALQLVGEDRASMVEYFKCLTLEPHYQDALWNYGEMLRLSGHFSSALNCFEKLLAIEVLPRDKLYHRMAVCAAHLPERSGDAEKWFQHEIDNTDDPLTHWEFALFLLGLAREDEAWLHYARRFDVGDRISVNRPLELKFSDWSGLYQKESTIVVSGEQGAGDMILFAAYIPTLLDMANAVDMTVVILVSLELKKLFQASFPDAIIKSFDETKLNEDLELYSRGLVYKIMIGDLPLFVPRTKKVKYLSPDPGDIRLVESYFSNMKSDQRYIGLTLNANPENKARNRLARNIPGDLASQWLKDVKNSTFIFLNTREHIHSMADLVDLPILDMSDFLTDYSRTAAVLLHLDSIVSVCTSTANLAGALGCKANVLVQEHADWRWAEGRHKWYKNCKILRQKMQGDWSPVLKNLVTKLNNSSGDSR